MQVFTSVIPSAVEESLTSYKLLGVVLRLIAGEIKLPADLHLERLGMTGMR